VNQIHPWSNLGVNLIQGGVNLIQGGVNLVPLGVNQIHP